MVPKTDIECLKSVADAIQLISKKKIISFDSCI